MQNHLSSAPLANHSLEIYMGARKKASGPFKPFSAVLCPCCIGLLYDALLIAKDAGMDGLGPLIAVVSSWQESIREHTCIDVRVQSPEHGLSS